MKKIVFTIICLLLATTVFAKEPEPQKFDIRVTIKYKDKTLKQIVEIENKISKLFDECYDISIEFEKKQNDNFNLHSYTLTPLDAITTVPGTGFMPNQR